MTKLAALLKSCIATPANIALSILTVLLLAWLLPELIKWALIDAIWSGNSSKACEGHDAACWVFIRLRFDQLLYGPYPASERWRVDVVAALAALAIGMMLMPVRRAGARKLMGLAALCLLPVVAAPLLAGGFFGLKPVATVDWGGIMLNIVIAAWSIATAIPLGLLLALGRRSEMPVIGYACATFIELWRSLPLIGVLFLAVVMFPLFVPAGFESDRLVRALIAFTLFNAAIFAEVFRGGLQAIPHGQREAARSLGLGYWRMTGLVVLPQVVRIVMPGMINTCVSIIKETTVVLIIGLVEFLAVLQIAFSDPEWLIGDQIRTTGYLFAALVFWSLCFALSRYSARLDRTLASRPVEARVAKPAD
jgi:general L-amino acid transport system permease protein